PKILYRDMSDLGQVYGETFQGVTSLWLRGSEAWAEISEPVKRDSADYGFSPPALDSYFHPNAALYRQFGPDSRVVVDSVGQVRLFHPLPAKVWSHVRIKERSESTFVSDVIVHGGDGQVLGQVSGLTLRTIDTETNSAERERKLYQMAWEPTPAPARESDQTSGEALIFCDQQGLGVELKNALKAREISTALIFANAVPHQANGNGLSVD